MKIIELTNKILVTLTNEETELLEKFNDEPVIAKSKLDERSQLLAHNLTVKNVLLRKNENGKIYYKKRISQH